MPCSTCGDICRCSFPKDPADYSTAPPRWLPEVDAVTTTPQYDLAASDANSSYQHQAVEASTPSASDAQPAKCANVDSVPNELPSTPAPEDSSAWRQELATRLNRYQSRRKPRPPRYPSLRLHFEEGDSSRAAAAAIESQPAQPRMASSSNHALALDAFAETAADVAPVPEPQVSPHSPPQLRPEPTIPAHPITAKILEFPRSWTPAPPPLDELAEPVITRPRILEAPEIVAPLPALGGITIEPAQRPELEKRPGIDIPLQSAPLSRRILSAAIDGFITAVACALFAFIFWKLTAIRPPRLQIIGIAAGLFAMFWSAYQYLLVTYSGATPGSRLARLELSRFDGAPANRRLRRWRVLASFLSAVSLGMGYAWVFLDEDSLCWHDRITHTYLAPKK